MSLDNIYLALIAKKAEQVILKTGFKNVLLLANSLSKGVKKNAIEKCHIIALSYDSEVIKQVNAFYNLGV
jgi:hypothetical protein